MMTKANEARTTLGGIDGKQPPPSTTTSGSSSNNPMTAGAGALASQFGIIKDVLEQGIRRITVQVLWYEGHKQYDVSVVAYYTDVRKVDQAIQIAASGASARPAPRRDRHDRHDRRVGLGTSRFVGDQQVTRRIDTRGAASRSSRPWWPSASWPWRSTMVWSSSMKTTFRTKSAIESNSARYRTVRLALERISREISMAYLSQSEDTSLPERRTFFMGKKHGEFDELRFSYFGHQRLYADGHESDTAQVLYYTQTRDREHRGSINLMRRETRRLSNLKADDAPGETDVVCDDIVKLRLEYWDLRDKQWREEWVTTAADGQPDRLPSRVRITLTVHDERGKEVPFQTEARIAMQEPLNLKPNDVQMPGAPTATGPTGATGPSATTNHRRRPAATSPHPPPSRFGP